MAGIMKQIKRAHKKVPVSPLELCKHMFFVYPPLLFLCILTVSKGHLKIWILSLIGGLKQLSGTVAGDRTDNQWLQYNSSTLPRTQVDWDQCVFVEKTHWGYYCWPRL